MSKISQLHAELSEQATELGFESIGEAEQAGYGVDWENAKLIRVEDQQEQAHQAWLKERDELLERLEKKQGKLKRMLCDDTGLYDLITDAINFIKKGEV